MPKAEFPKRNFSLIGKAEKQKSRKAEEGRLNPSKQR
jgi:hypothetical protein